MGLRGNCHLGAFFFPRASFFSTFLRTLARSARALLFVIAIFWLVVHFHVLLRVGPACAGSAPRSPRCSFSRACRGLQGAACLPCLAELIFCLHSVACLSSIGPTLLFRMFSAFSDVDSKVCVCVCVCVCVIWVPTFSRARRCFPLFLGRLLGRRACLCSSLSFLGWPSIFMFSSGPAQHALGRPQVRRSAAGSSASRGLLQRASCMSA